MASRSLGILRRFGQIVRNRVRLPQDLPRPSPGYTRSPVYLSSRSVLCQVPGRTFLGPNLGFERNVARMGFCVELAPLASGSQIAFQSMNRVAKNCLASICEVQNENRDEITSLDQLETGAFLQKGCNGAVYAARIKSDISGPHRLEPSEFKDWPLAFKMVFNYVNDREPSDADVRALFAPEAVPYTALPDHPSVAKVYGAFVQSVPPLPMAKEKFPDACPSSLYPELEGNCFGSEKTLFIVMERYSCSLSEKLSAGALRENEAIRVLLQLLEGDVVMKEHNIAHRDIHPKNILIDEKESGKISACIADFGCSTDRLVRQRNSHFRAGSVPGVPMLQAPECVDATNSHLDYRKADLWAIGALAYNLFEPGSNPFVKSLDARSYRDEDLPDVAGAPAWLNRLVHQMLRRDPQKRPSSEQCANILHLYLLDPPSSWLLGSKFPSPSELRDWVLMKMVRLILTFRKDEDQRLLLNFFIRLDEDPLKHSLEWLRSSFKKKLKPSLRLVSDRLKSEFFKRSTDLDGELSFALDG